MRFSEYPYKATIDRETITVNYPSPDVVTTKRIFSGKVDLQMGTAESTIPFKADYKIMFDTPVKGSKRTIDLRTDDLVVVDYSGRKLQCRIVNYSFSELGKTTLYVVDKQINNG